MSQSNSAQTATFTAAASKIAALSLVTSLAVSLGMPTIAKRVVYILRSESDPSQSYIGLTGEMDQRLQWHNNGPTGHTLRYRPWSLLVSLEFRTEAAARRFEKYLKSGSGRAFAKRHFGQILTED